MFARLWLWRNWRRTFLLTLLVLCAALFAGGALASTNASRRGHEVASPGDIGVVSTIGEIAPTVPHTADAFVYLQKNGGDTPGTCLPPDNGGTVALGCRFALDIMVNAGSNVYPNGLDAQQVYFTFTNQTIRISRFTTTTVSCIAATTLPFRAGIDNVVFDSNMQNTVNNSTAEIAYSTAALSNCAGDPPGSGGGCPDPVLYPSPDPQCCSPFRIGRIPICATSPGVALLHWQFHDPACTSQYPPGPETRDTELVNYYTELVSNCDLFVDYTFCVDCVPPPTPTPANTATPAPMLVGHVTWQHRSAQPSTRQQLPITLTLKSAVGSETNYPVRSTDASGFFTVSVSGLPNGTYDWRVKGPDGVVKTHYYDPPGFLANSGTLLLTGAQSTQVEMGLMRIGDCNNDNVVNSLDFPVVKNSFGLTPITVGYDNRADFDGNQVITAVDFNALRSNFGSGGSPPIGPRP